MASNSLQLLFFSSLFYYLVAERFLVTQLKNNGNLVSDGKSCKIQLEYFANATSNLTKCAIMHARPIRLCEKCIHYYLNFLDAYDKILKAKDEGGHTCKMELVNLDRLEVIEGAFNYVYGLWQRGHCDNCFNVDNNGTLTSELSNTTVKFQELYSDTHDCIKNFYNETSETYIKGVCKNCTDKYCALNKYYEELKGSVGDGMLCMDIVDTMNATRTKWSKQLGCSTSALKAEIPLIISVILLLTTPVVFYSAAKRFSVKAHNRLLRHENREDFDIPDLCSKINSCMKRVLGIVENNVSTNNDGQNDVQ